MSTNGSAPATGNPEAPTPPSEPETAPASSEVTSLRSRLAEVERALQGERKVAAYNAETAVQWREKARASESREAAARRGEAEARAVVRRVLDRLEEIPVALSGSVDPHTPNVLRLVAEATAAAARAVSGDTEARPDPFNTPGRFAPLEDLTRAPEDTEPRPHPWICSCPTRLAGTHTETTLDPTCPVHGAPVHGAPAPATTTTTPTPEET